MQINITTRHGHIGEETQDKLTTKVQKLTRHFDRLTAIELVIDLQDNHKPRVDLLVDAEHKHDFRAHDQGDNLLTMVESVVHKMDQQLRKYKEKTIDGHRDSAAKRQEPVANETAAEDE